MNLNIFKTHIKQNKIVFFEKEKFAKKYKNVLVTGAGGTIGKELSFLLNNSEIEKVVFLDSSELNLHNLKNDLHDFDKVRDYIVADIRDEKRISQIFEECKPDMVIHAAAYKHVPLMEPYFYEALRTNLEGTINVFDACKKNLVKDFIFITTDKAVNPKSKMGVSKKLAELYIESYVNFSSVNFKIIRFGNVINSSGSIIPLLKKQVANGNTITLSNIKVSRYFILPELVAKLILNISLLKTMDYYFLLEMNQPILIKNLANEIIETFADKEIAIVETNLKKGEKLHEQLLNSNENLNTSGNANYWIVKKKVLTIKISEKIKQIVCENKSFNLVKRNKLIDEILSL